MANTVLKSKLFAGASGFAALTNLIGTKPVRWYDTTLTEGTAFPAIVVRVISSPPMYTFTNRLATSWNRCQFMIYAQPDSAAADIVAQALFSFFDQWFGGTGITGLVLNPNLVIADRDDLEPKLEPPVFLRVIEAKIWNNCTV